MNILSALINLVKFTEEQQDFVHNLQEQSNNIVDESDRLDTEIEEMREQINRIKSVFCYDQQRLTHQLTKNRSQRAAEEPECEDLRAKIAEVYAHLGATRETQNRMMTEVEKYKRERASALEQKVPCIHLYGICNWQTLDGDP